MPFQRPRGERAENQSAPNFIRPLNDKRAVVGERTALECQLSGHPEPVVKWLKDGHNVNLCPDYEIVQEGNRHRLIIPAVMGADSGRFTAQALNPAGSAQSTCILIVAPAPTPVPGAKSVADSPAPPQTPVGPSAPIFLKELKHAPLKPGALLVLEARVAGMPVPTVEWLKNGQPLQNYRAKCTHDASSGIVHLTIPQMFADDVGEYACRAVNVHGDAVTTAQLLPREQYERWFSDEKTRLTRDRKAQMTGGQQQQQQPRPLGHLQAAHAQRLTQSDVETSWTMSETETEPELMERSGDMSGSGFSGTAQGVKPVVRQPLRGLRLTEGTDAILQANVIGSPKPQIYWLKNGVPLQPSGPRMQMSYKGALALLKIGLVNMGDGGEYTMIAENKYGQAESTARIEVYPLLTSPIQRSQATTPLPQQQLFQQQEEQQQRRQREQQEQKRQLELEFERLEEERARLRAEEEAAAARDRQHRAAVREQEERREQQRVREYQELERRERQQQAEHAARLLESAQQARELEELRRRQQQQAQPYQLQFASQQQQQQQPVQQHQYHLYHQSQPQPEEQQQPLHPEWRRSAPQQTRQQEPAQHHHRLNVDVRQPQQHQHQQYYQQQQQQQQPLQHSPRIEQHYPKQQQQYYQHQHQQDFRPPVPAHLTPSPQPPDLHLLQRAHPVHHSPRQSQQSLDRAFVDEPARTQYRAQQPSYGVQVDQEDVGRPYFYRTQQELDQRYQLAHHFTPQQQQHYDMFRSRQQNPPAAANGKSNGAAAVANGAAAPNGSAPAGAGGGGGARKPPQFIVQPQSVSAQAGDQVVFSAKATGDPLPALTFSKADGKPLAGNARFKVETFADGSARFTIDKVTAADADTYVCMAKNAGGSFQSRFSLAVMQAKAPEAPTFVTRFQSLSIYEGDSVKLYAKANGDDVKYAWFRDNDALTNGPHYKIESKGAETALTIQDATMAEGGWYRCDATNQHGTTQLKGRVVVQSRAKLGTNAREQITLRKVDRRNARSPIPQRQFDVSASKAAPSFGGQLQPQQLVEGQVARLELQFSPGDDPNLKVAWLKDGKAIIASSRVVTVCEFGSAVLEISPATASDSGEYTVVAVNPLGEARASTIIQIIGHRPIPGGIVTSSTTNSSGGAITQMGSVYAAAGPLCAARLAGTISGGVGRPMDLPNFTTELRSQELFEGSPLHLEAKITPINDPTLKIEWFLNGKPLPAGGRIQQQLLHGFITLDIAELALSDVGTITARAVNSVGEAESNAVVVVHPRHNLQEFGGRPLDVEDVREIQFAHGKGDEAPRFITQLQDFFCTEELGRSYFEARISPINDPSLRVSWLKDGHALPSANRIQTFHNFGIVSLTLHPTYPEDAGTYACVLHSVHGQAQSGAVLKTTQSEPLQLDTRHEQSLQIIGYLDGHQVHIGPQAVDRPEEFHSLETPRFARELAKRVEARENEPVHFEARLQPASDVKMQVEWFHNGAPLAAAHRFRPMFDFGYVALDILYAYPEDSGVYELRAHNEIGETSCQLELVVIGEKTLYLDAHHPEGLERIQELEQPRFTGLPEVEDRACDDAPQFLGDLSDVSINEHENIHLDIRVAPVNDPTMRVEWFVNGAPLLTGSRIKALYELGFIALDIKGAISEDSGTYVVRVKNALGEASKQCNIIVAPSGTILSDTQHEQSLDKITYLEGLNKYAREEIEETGPDSPPIFAVQLQDIGEVDEGETVHLECQVKPYNDNTLRVQWLKDGHPISTGHRYRTFYDFGFVSLDILGVYGEDSGTYSCVAENALGRVETTTQFVCRPKAAILGDTQHPSSYARIQQIEAPRAAPAELPDVEQQAPSFVKQLGPALSVEEGDAVYLEAQVLPIDDNSMTYEWLLNGAPLMKAHRYVLSYDFGYIALNILYCFPEDSGEYTLVVRNAKGEARSTVRIDCSQKGAMLTDSFHPNSIQRIEQLEAPQLRAEPAPEAEKQAPVIVQGLPSSIDQVHESQTLHLEAQITPVDDNQLQVMWLHNGAPLKASSRYRHLNDFGFVSLDIDYIIADDAGTYTLVIANSKGRAESSTSFEVERLGSIVSDTAHPESLRRIQEMEQLQPAVPSVEDQAPEAPVFTQQLTGPSDVLKEGQSVHMDCVVQPINDPALRIEWFFNGAPLQFGSRIRMIHDFGYVGLEFLHVHPEDSGTYECCASNAAGSASTQLTIECRPRRNLYLDTQHAESWARIQEFENKEDERPPTPELTFEPPTFIEQLQGSDGLIEGAQIRLVCRLVPVNDPTLRILWTRNGQPLPQASRFMYRRDVELCTLDILALYGEDSGEYACHAKSDFGQATTSCQVGVIPTDALLLDTQHEESWRTIQEIESRKPPEPIVEEAEKIPPRFTVPLAGNLGEFAEGVPIHLECQVEPTNDNQLTVQWLHNGQPLANGHRFRTTHDFGFVALDILYAFAQDTGEWALVARNELGEANTVATFNVTPRGTIYTDSQHPESWQRIQEIEAPRAAPEEAPAPEIVAPKFVEQMQSLDRIEFQSAHFETRVTPINDPNLRIQWLKDGAPMGNSNRFKLTYDFGFVALDIMHTVAEDAGTYSVVATNEKGTDQVSATLSVVANPSIIGNTQHEQSWARIQQLEAVKAPGEEAAEAAPEAPRWVRPLNSADGLVEGQPAHFEAQFAPFGDPRTTVHWFLNGRPLPMSSRRIMRNDFGLVTLDLQYTLAEDAGEYMVLVHNEAGEDQTTGSLSCQSRASILGDVQHQASWQRIQEIEAPRPAPAEHEAPTFAKPSFTQPLQSVDVDEGGVVLLEARYMPVNDPSLRIQWFLDDQPLADSNWITMTQDFGVVTLRVAPAYARHSGVYSCKATNGEGAAVTSGKVTVQGADSLLLDTSHPQSLQRIQELEAIDKYARLEAPEREYSKPQWIQEIGDVDGVGEGQVIELHGLVEPSGDPSMRVEWFLNGQPLRNANRFRQEYEFGNVILTIVHVLPHDSGVYTCRAWNALGEASTSATVKVDGYEQILLDSQHPVSWQRIQELEAPRIIEEIEEVIQKEKPYFLTQLESFQDVPEGTPIHLEATFQPARDPDLKAEWRRNGQPIGASQLVQTRHELGWATLDILSVNPDHNGMYSLHIANSEGEAATSASVKVAGSAGVIGDVRHEESWKRIQVLEAPRPEAPEAPAPVFDHPAITSSIQDVDVNEGDPVHFEASFVPVNDPRLQVQWLRNGQPLAHGAKYAISHDFGICMLDIGYAYPEDQGVYQLRVWNDDGEAVTSATLKCAGKDALLLDTQHEESWRRIQEMEAPRPEMEEAPAAPKPAPRFTGALAAPADLVEGQPAHFETTLEPIDDAAMQIQWYLNGAPISASSRVKMINDFGWVIMDIGSVDGRDSGEWKCVARNAAGEAEISTSLTVTTRENIAYDSLQPQSLQRISEIEAPRAVPEEAPAPAAEAPRIVAQLALSGGQEEGASAHLEAQYEPVNDPKIKVEWFRNGQPLPNSNRYKQVHDFGFAIMEILSVLSHDAGEYTLKVSNEAGEATSAVQLAVETKSGLLLETQNEAKARAVEQLEDALHRRPDEVVEEIKEVVPVFVEPLSAPVECDEGDRAHFTARYEPVHDNQLQVQWFLDGRPLKTGSRVKTISDFGFVVLQIAPVYPEDSGEYTCKAINRVGEAVTSTKLACRGKEHIISATQLPERMAGAGKRIAEIEAPRPQKPDAPDVSHGPPRFTTQILSPPSELLEGEIAHLEAQIEPVADPRLRVEWFHDGQPMRNSARMKMTQDFGFVVLDLCPAEPQDTGTWTCKIANEHGQAESSCDIKVVGQSGVSYEWISPAQRKERINELEDWINRPKEDLTIPAQEFDAPRFTQELADLGQLSEADATAFTCVLEPIGDPTLRVEWTHNGHAIPYSNRIQQSNEFGVATLLIKHLIAADSGEYRCIASNAKGRAETSGTVQVESIIQTDAPQVVQPLVDTIDGTSEGDSIHLECRVTPINDPLLKVRWYRNGAPLPEASRFRPSFEFGFVSLDILYAYPEDNGDYELVAENAKGEARTKTRITVLPGRSLEFGSQAHGSTQDHLESHFRQHSNATLALKSEDAYDEHQKRAPQFLTPLANMGVEEGEFARFETQIVPFNDPYMKLEWFKDQKPVLIGHRFRSTLDFGFACLDLLFALPDDTGEYTCVATNRFGQATTSAKLACAGGRHVITERQMPQGLKVSSVKKNQAPYFAEGVEQAPRQKQAPEFTIKPRSIQVDENGAARFECAVVGHPKPKVTWFLNGNQAIHGARIKLNYDGLYYLIIQNCRVSDAGEIVVIARNSEGEVQAPATLDVFQNDDFRSQKLKPTQFISADELQQRQIQWQKETLGKLGEAFETAPRADAQRLMQVERSKTPIEPLESEELIQKFMRSKDDLAEHIAKVELEKKQFKGLELEPVALKPGQVSKYEPEREELEKVNLRSRPATKGEKEPRDETPDWAVAGQNKLGNVEGRFNRMATPPREVVVPARDQIALKGAKPTRASELSEGEHVRIAEERARIKTVQQGPEKPKEEQIVHKQQVQMKKQGAPKVAKPGESVKIEEVTLKDAPVLAKPVIPESTISSKQLYYQTYRERAERRPRLLSDATTDSEDESGVRRTEYTFSPRLRERTIGFHMIRPTPTKLGQSQKAPPSLSQQLKPVQAEVGKSARFFVAFEGALPIKVTWYRDAKEVRPTFENQIRTTNTGSTLDIGRLKATQAGAYMVRLENVAGTVESTASLAVNQPVNRGKAPDFSARLTDLRVQQNAPAVFSCSISGEPTPTINWFKDGQPLPNDGRLVAANEGTTYTLSLAETLAQDVGIYECVAKNTAGEARCKARLNVNLVTTGKGAEAGPRLEAPRFTGQIQPVVADEGGAVVFTAKFTGSPEPSIRWYRNNEPIKKSSSYTTTQSTGETSLKIAAAKQEDVAEYKVEASNPAGKASSVANLVLKPKSGRIAGVNVQRGGSSSTGPAAAPQFLAKLSDVTARPGQNAKFSAQIAGSPLPTIAWTHNGRPVNPAPTVKISLDGNVATLELVRVGPASAGDYTLTATSAAGSSSCTAKLALAR